MRSIRYQEIADELRGRARAAAPGSLLPSESELSAEFAASRVTVRRALERSLEELDRALRPADLEQHLAVELVHRLGG